MSAKFELKKSRSGKFMFNLKAGNNEIILTSQMYESKASAETGIASVQQNSPLDGRYERKTDSDGKPYFVLQAANKEIIGKSEMYASRSAMEKGIASVKKNAAIATIDDMTAQEGRATAAAKS
ncbi:MAG TPA: YegP family protein [Bryobacteraceae bacterium]|jgi:hypothetical protein